MPLLQLLSPRTYIGGAVSLNIIFVASWSLHANTGLQPVLVLFVQLDASHRCTGISVCTLLRLRVLLSVGGATTVPIQ
ncbi:hypothetical protein BDY19DRAFT_977333 [Irpex rosettiformis]|uniref:Uncharacterized protein n=1 Tax=Irpex rosettiformis TaxID=378272 RepID=A0ACB8TNI6_9APHY|nr:hypothetical protein BDY19DRAFT_977333 [Irpex rosettiformis]